MNFIFLNMSSQFEWDKGIYNTNKHILDEFLIREDVDNIISIDFLPFSTKGILRTYIKSKLYKKDVNTIKKGIFYKFNKIDEKLFGLKSINIKNIDTILQSSNLKKEDFIIVNFNPLNTEYLNIFKDNKKIFYGVDNWINNNIFKKQKNKLEENYKKIIEKSDITLTVSENLKQEFIEKYNKKEIYFIGNGIDIKHYQNFFIDKKEDIDMFEFINPKVGYLGIIKNDRVDPDLLELIVKENHNIEFKIAGITHGDFDKNRFNNYQNIEFVGGKSYNKMPEFYKSLDLCIIPHLVNDFTKYMDPKKIYEYLASGKKIITTEISGIDDLVEKINKYEKIIYKVKNKEEFNETLKDLIYKNNYKLSETSKENINEVLKEFSWKNKVDKIFDFIKNG